MRWPRQRLKPTLLSVSFLVCSTGAFGWSPSTLPTGYEVQIVQGAAGFGYRVGGKEMAGHQLDGALSQCAKLDPKMDVWVMLPKNGDAPPATAVLELLARTQRAGLRTVSFWWFAENQTRRMEGPYHPLGSGMGPLQLYMTHHNPYQLADISADARQSLKESLRPEVAADLRKTLIPEVALTHLWKVVAIVFAAGCVAGWGIARIFSGKHARMPASHCT